MIFDVIKKAKQLFYDNKNSGLDVNNVQDAIDELTQAIVEVDAINEGSGESILLTDTLDDTVLDFKVYGKSVQDGTPTPDSPVDIVSVGDSGYFDGELLQGAYTGANGNFTLTGQYICNTNMMPCKANDKIKLEYAEIASQLMILFYDSNKNFISYVQSQSSSVLETTAIANACYFNFDISNPNGITPQAVKPITVTINDKYALIVKSKGKNSLKNVATTQTINGVKFTVNEDKSVTIVGTPTQASSFVLNSTNYLSKGKKIISGFPKEIEGRLSLVVDGVIYSSMNNNDGVFDVVNSGNYGVFIVVNEGVAYNHTVYPMIRPADTDATYEPYKETVSYIPLNEPLRSSLDGSVSDVAYLSEINRRFTKIVYDGSDDEGWAAHSVANWFLIKRPTGSINNLNTMCSHYTTNTTLNNVDYGFYIGGTYINFKNKDITSVDEWKAWLQANPITVVYELTEPVVESIDPVDITTYADTTYITNSNNAPMWVEYYSNSSVGQRLAKIDEKLTELKTVKNIYIKSAHTDTIYINAKVCGKVVELSAAWQKITELEFYLPDFFESGYAPLTDKYVICSCTDLNNNSTTFMGILHITTTGDCSLYDMSGTQITEGLSLTMITFNTTYLCN